MTILHENQNNKKGTQLVNLRNIYISHFFCYIFDYEALFICFASDFQLTILHIIIH